VCVEVLLNVIVPQGRESGWWYFKKIIESSLGLAAW
jgi:hypothetical protein